MLPVTDATFQAEVLEADRPVLVDFTAPWCAPCRQMTPVLRDLADQRDDVRIVSLDVDTEKETAARYGVLGMPTFVLFRGGAPVLTLRGAMPRKRLEQQLDAVL